MISATKPMMFIEPESCYAARMRIPQHLPPIPAATPTTPPKPTPPGRQRYDDFWTEIAFEILKDNGDGPMRITKIVNESLRWGKFAGRERTDQKKMMFKVIGRLARSGRLDYYKSHFVTIPTSDTRYKAFLAQASKPLNLPPPCV